MSLRLHAGNLLCTACLAMLGGCDYLARFSLEESDEHTIEARSLDLAPRKIWGLTVADFDNDGDDDLLVAGHGGKTGDRIFYYHQGAYTASEFALAPAPDRHGCAAGDVNSDGRLDIYCTAGAARGGGANPNELWLAGREAGHYRRIRKRFGAEDPSGRGRLARFFNANRDSEIDLFSTVWGKREDTLPNSSARYLNRSGSYRRSDDAWTGSWGGRCVAVLDLDNDGLDELAVCNAREGAHLLHRSAGSEYADGAALDTPSPVSGVAVLRADQLAHPSHWWLAMAALPAYTGNPPLPAGDQGKRVAPRGQDLAALILDNRGGTLQVFSGSDLLSSPSAEARIRVPLRWLPVWGARACRPAAIAATDVTNDGFDDILITRVDGSEPNSACESAADIVLFGPDYQSFATLPKNRFGTRSQAYAANGHFLRMSAGEGWEGDIEIIKVLPASAPP